MEREIACGGGLKVGRRVAFGRRGFGRGWGVVVLAVAVGGGWGGGDVWGGIVVPGYSSRPGAPYTLYLDLGGFSYSGTWAGGTPGVTPAYTVDGDASTFNAQELGFIKEIWARVAEKYSAFSINVTTVDPAVAAGQAGSDAARQSYYDSTARMMHTVIGGNGSWSGGGGISFVGVTEGSYSNTGYHTNWVFAAQAPNYMNFVAEAVAHEDGHGLSLGHQSDFDSQGALVSEYSSNGGGTGDGSYAPTMGVSYYTQRGLWRNGLAHGNGPVVQNDMGVIFNHSGMTPVNDGIGHGMAVATVLPLVGTNVNPALAKGTITPKTVINPNPMGVDSYTKDYFSFFSVGAPMTLMCVDGAQLITPGVADPGATLDATLKIYNSAGTLVATGVRSGNTYSNTFTGSLPAGNYTAEVASIGGYQSTFDASATYFTGGSFFLTGANMYTKFNLVGKDLSGTALSSQNLASANLASANLSFANLTSANLTSATLKNANLANATLTSASFTAADLTLADLRGATGFTQVGSTLVRGTIMPGGGVGGVAGFALASGETLRVRANAIAATTSGTITGTGGAFLQVEAGGSVVLAPAALAGMNVRSLDGVTLNMLGNAGARSVLRSGTVTAVGGSARSLMPEVAVLSSVSIASDGGALGSRAYFGTWDVGTNDAVVRTGSLAILRDQARDYLTSSGGHGLGSSSGIANTGVAVMSNLIGGVAFFSTFDGVAVTGSDVLVRFTYVGDTNLDGVLNGADFSNVLEGLSAGLTGWQNGDFNYDGVVSGVDYSMFATAYSAFLSNPVSLGMPGGDVVGGGAVPEPGVAGVGVVGLGVLGMRRRRGV